MANKTATCVIKNKSGTAAAWIAKNSVLAAGEIGYETDTKKIKIGDGTTKWNSLSYMVADVAVNANYSTRTGNIITSIPPALDMNMYPIFTFNAQDGAAASVYVATNISMNAVTKNIIFTGTPAAPTATAGTNTTQLATTAYVATATNQLKRSTAYAVGDIVYSPKLKSYQYLQCTTAGTTAATEPDLTTLSVGGGGA